MKEAAFWREKLAPYTKKSLPIALFQVGNLLFLMAALYWSYSIYIKQSTWYLILYVIALSFLMLRVFVLMHDCGHGSLFRNKKLNQFFGWMMGVFCGMPQYVWSKHHAFHHKTNGDWESYRGPMGVRSVREYEKMNESEKKKFWFFRRPEILIVGGFVYLVFNPRVNWMKGLLVVAKNLLASLLPGSKQSPSEVLSKCESRYWKTKKEFKHMSYNNLALIPAWILMSQWLGAFEFLTLTIAGISFAGTMGILFFTLQHNFEGSYAASKETVDYYRAALEGTSYLKLPGWFNWFTADISFHHIHHLSAAIPNYRLKKAHKDLEPFFTEVKRLSTKDIFHSFGHQLWDEDNGKLISKKEYNASLTA